MKRLLLLTIIVGLFVSPTLVSAQDGDENAIAYGDTVDGTITNQTYEAIYTFEGEAGDVVIIAMNRTGDQTLDPYLYLTTPENDILAQNDDSDDLDSRIVYRLPDAGSYVIVATRLGDRAGTSEGDYQLTLDKARLAEAGEVIEGTYRAEESAPTHTVVVDQDGIYEVIYRHIQGEYYPNLSVQALLTDSTYFEDVAQLTGQGIRGGSIMLELMADKIYILSLQPNYYSSDGGMALYTLQVNLVEANQEELSQTSDG